MITLKTEIKIIVLTSDLLGSRKIPIKYVINKTETPATKIRAAVKIIGSTLLTSTDKAETLNPQDIITSNNKT